ncbi:hypothetical protein D9757_013037 [Collybiopsis confluens]|uniref:Uncharacterized protein n=1 Tax=Collybiopsis confluens TaxID=2823264 RepID=A0A8H5GHJ9_9AGAR|nr:hypothetical protein D9757_013037 [Collybiopsis confluens]
MNSMLASLNTRQYISSSSQKHTRGWQSIPPENLVLTAVSNPQMVANSTPKVNIDTALAEHYGGSGLH